MTNKIQQWKEKFNNQWKENQYFKATTTSILIAIGIIVIALVYLAYYIMNHDQDSILLWKLYLQTLWIISLNFVIQTTIQFLLLFKSLQNQKELKIEIVHKSIIIGILFTITSMFTWSLYQDLELKAMITKDLPPIIEQQKLQKEALIAISKGTSTQNEFIQKHQQNTNINTLSDQDKTKIIADIATKKELTTP